MMSRSSPVVFLTILFLSPAPAQDPASAEPEIVTHDSPATFSSRVNLVSVPVVIRDKDGRSIGGLKQEDFQLSDKGKPQIITRFTVQTNAAEIAAAAESSPTSNANQPPSSPQPELPDRYVAYFFDDIHMQPGDLLKARTAANRHLDEALDPKMRAGVFTTSGRTTMWFTDDVAKLHETINHIQPWTTINDKTACPRISYYIADTLINREMSLSPVKGIDPGNLLAEEIYIETGKCLPPGTPGATVLQYMWSSASKALIYGTEEAQSALSVLIDLISKMSSRPGTRTIVLVSPGFILTSDHRYFENQILDNAIRAKVMVNSLDIRGVYTPLRARPFDAEYGGGSATAGPIAQVRDKADQDEVFEAGNVLAELAYGTGGAVRTDNDFVDGLKQLAARPEHIYVLGFSPDNLKYDGSYHRLKVKLKEPGYQIEARRGYWAPSHAGSASEAAREELKESFFSRDEISDIPLDIRADFFRAENGKPEIDVVARLDAKTLKFRKAADRNNDTLTVVTGIFDRNGNYISGVERVIDMRLRDSSLDVLENSGISVDQSFNVAPGQYIVRVVVKDGEGNLTAARNTGIEIP